MLRRSAIAMENDEVANALEETADMLEAAEENFVRMRTHRNADRSIRDQIERAATVNRYVHTLS